MINTKDFCKNIRNLQGSIISNGSLKTAFSLNSLVLEVWNWPADQHSLETPGWPPRSLLSVIVRTENIPGCHGKANKSAKQIFKPKFLSGFSINTCPPLRLTLPWAQSSITSAVTELEQTARNHCCSTDKLGFDRAKSCESNQQILWDLVSHLCALSRNCPGAQCSGSRGLQGHSWQVSRCWWWGNWGIPVRCRIRTEECNAQSSSELLWNSALFSDLSMESRNAWWYCASH